MLSADGWLLLLTPPTAPALSRSRRQAWQERQPKNIAADFRWWTQMKN